MRSSCVNRNLPIIVKVRSPASYSSVSCLAVPRSIKCRYPLASMAAFQGFKSRQTIEFLWRYSRISRKQPKQKRAELLSQIPKSDKQSKKSPPYMYFSKRQTKWESLQLSASFTISGKSHNCNISFYACKNFSIWCLTTRFFSTHFSAYLFYVFLFSTRNTLPI